MAASLSRAQKGLFEKYIGGCPDGFDGHSKATILKHLVQHYDEKGLNDALTLWLQGESTTCQLPSKDACAQRCARATQANCTWISTNGQRFRARQRYDASFRGLPRVLGFQRILKRRSPCTCSYDRRCADEVYPKQAFLQ